MTKPVTTNELFDLWQKMVNPGAFPLQSLMFPVLDAKEIEKKIGELETVEHWLRANLNMLQLSIKSLEFQRDMLKGGDKARAAMGEGALPGGAEMPNPALWAWNMMNEAGRAAGVATERAAQPKPRKRKPTSRKA
jgi:hypothetical protein